MSEICPNITKKNNKSDNKVYSYKRSTALLQKKFITNNAYCVQTYKTALSIKLAYLLLVTYNNIHDRTKLILKAKK